MRGSKVDAGFVKVPGGGFAPAAEFPSGRVVTDDGELLILGEDRRLHPSTEGEVRTGVMNRTEDASGVSGTGVVADFAEFPSGRVLIEWRNDENENLRFDDTGLDVRPHMESAVGIHGHGGRTEFIYDDTGEVADP